MAKTIPIIGLEPDELPWVRSLVTLLRHPDPAVKQLTRQAILFLEDSAAATALPSSRPARALASVDRVS